MSLRVLALWLTGVAVGVAAAACGSPIVGGECRAGTTECDGRCVDPRVDPEHCGACDTECGSFTCEEGECTPERRPDLLLDAAITPDGAVFDGGADASSTLPPVDAGRGSAGFPLSADGGFFGFDRDASVGDGRLGCPLGEETCNGLCVDTSADAANCGACGTTCATDDVCSGGRCLPTCEAPLSRCGLACFDLTQDPRHCGACGNRCASGVCEDGECADAVPGHVAVIGHDYRNANAAMRRLAGNALFLARGAPVRALVYRGSAEQASISGVEQAIALVEREDGRTWTQTQADPDRVSAQLRDVEAFVIHAQAGASDAELADLGERWGLALAQFAVTGGVVLVFETQSSDNGGTYRVLEAAGLFSASRRERIGSQRLEVLDVGVGVAVQLPSSGYQSADTTVRFIDPVADARVVVADADGEAVVVHRIVTPP